MSAPITPEVQPGPLVVLPPDLRPSVDHLVTEDDTPVDNIYSEKQQRLLTRPLYSSWSGPGEGRPFVALANVGMFFAINQPPLVPDFLLSLDVRPPDDLSQKRQRSYFFWEAGKKPDGVVEVVSNLEGAELTGKLQRYAELGIPIYVVWDPELLLGTSSLYVFEHRYRSYVPRQDRWFPDLNLGLTIWHGSFEQCETDWLRWCDKGGVVIPTGEERAEHESQRAEQESQRAEQESQRAETAEQRARAAEQRIERLAAKLRELGVEPPNGPQ